MAEASGSSIPLQEIRSNLTAPSTWLRTSSEPFSRQLYDALGPWISDSQLPICYQEGYNISFFGLERLSSFDACKFQSIVEQLLAEGLISTHELVSPRPMSNDQLLRLHTAKYLAQLGTNWKVSQLTELPGILLLPPALLQWKIVQPLRLHCSGTILAAGFALQQGWGINLGGGMHHANHEECSAWCAFDDLMLAVLWLREATAGAIKRILLVDLDAHQGNGIQRDKLHLKDQDLFILDMNNPAGFPHDEEARAAIDIDVPVRPGTGNDEYLALLVPALQDAVARSHPDFIMYNAGTDVLAGDKSGRLALTPVGIMQRDEIVWQAAVQLGVPICMTLGGGYQPEAASVVAASIANLMRTFKLRERHSPVSATSAAVPE